MKIKDQAIIAIDAVLDYIDRTLTGDGIRDLPALKAEAAALTVRRLLAGLPED